MFVKRPAKNKQKCAPKKGWSALLSGTIPYAAVVLENIQYQPGCGHHASLPARLQGMGGIQLGMRLLVICALCLNTKGAARDDSCFLLSFSHSLLFQSPSISHRFVICDLLIPVYIFIFFSLSPFPSPSPLLLQLSHCIYLFSLLFLSHT